MPTLAKKVFISVKVALIFVLLNLPIVYEFTNRLFGETWNLSTRCPTTKGVLIHAGLFYLINYLSMRGSLTHHQKMVYALQGTAIFLVLSSAPVYRFVRGFLGPSIASAQGCPTTMGVFVHGAVFTAILVGLMSYL